MTLKLIVWYKVAISLQLKLIPLKFGLLLIDSYSCSVIWRLVIVTPSLSLSPTPSPLSKKQKKNERKENPRMKREKCRECRVLAGYHLILKKKSLPLNQFGGKFLQPTTWRLIKPSTLSFSHMIYLLSHVTYLSNTSGWLHESPCTVYVIF